MDSVLVISVHPDDETLGCGGTLLKHKAYGDAVSCMFVTEGNEHQAALIDSVCDAYDFDAAPRLKLPELELADLSLNDLIPPISKVINELKPTTVYLPNRSDAHSDHRRVAEAVMACTKSFRYPFINRLLMCEITSETDASFALTEYAFVPNAYSDITIFFEQKMEILKLFESELLPEPHLRSPTAIRALHRYRGSQVSVEYAEAFMLLRDRF